MSRPSVRAVSIGERGGDARGGSFPISLDALGPLLEDSLGAVFPIRAAHVTTLRPGFVRGNHFHTECHEILLVLPGSSWSLWWDSGEGTEAHSAPFDGSQTVAVLVPPHCSHAIRNDSEQEMFIVGMSDRVYDSGDPDVHVRRVV